MNKLEKISPANFVILKSLALLLPLYFVFYSPLHETPKDPKVKILWRWVFMGFALYAVIALLSLI